MGQPAATYPFYLRAGTIKRVLRRGRRHLCGLCRASYDSENGAVSCLADCWGELLKLDPVIQRRRGRKMLYRCRFCARDHARSDDARECASDCRARQEAQHAAEMALFASDDIFPKPRRLPRKKAAPPVMIAAPARPAKKKAEVPAEVVVAPEAAPQATPAPAPVEGEAKKPKPDKAFFRDGAEYVCTICQEHFFTKLEVQACFDAH